MLQEDPETTIPSLGALPMLVSVLSPLESMRDRRQLAKAVAQWIVDTVAIGCEIHLLEGPKLRAVAALGGVDAPDTGLVERVIESGKPEVLADRLGPATWVLLPLGGGDSAFGSLSVALSEPADEINAHHMRDLARVASGLAFAITEAAAHERANQISQTLQASLLPAELAVGPWFDLAARYVPGTADLRIGGDWYDSQILNDGTVALSVGDVAGHGVEAAAQMGELRSAMAALRLVRSAPEDVIAVVHRLTIEKGYFATVICVRLDPTGNLLWASAGHLPPLVIHEDGQSELLDTDQSPPLGAGCARGVPINRYRLNPGDTVLLYTDGLVERRDVSLDHSLQLLVDRISGPSWTSTSDLVDEVIRDREQADYTGDDIAVLAARWGEPAGSSRRRAG